MPDNIDPRYKDSESRGNPQYTPVPIRRAPQGPKPVKVGDTNTPMKGERLHAGKKWRPKGKK